jgi:hypothetical protein
MAQVIPIRPGAFFLFIVCCASGLRHKSLHPVDPLRPWQRSRPSHPSRAAGQVHGGF